MPVPDHVRELTHPDDLFHPERAGKPPADDGVVANARLTALLGTTLIAALSAEGITLLDTRGWIDWHVGLGVLVGVLVCAKLGSTGYRMLSYYRRDGRYVASGPPHPFMRVLAPLLVVATAAVIGTGFLTLYAGGSWRFLHKLSFIGWIGLAALHVLVYLWRLPRMIRAPRGLDARPHRAPVVSWLVLAVVATVGTWGALWYVGVMPALPVEDLRHH